MRERAVKHLASKIDTTGDGIPILVLNTCSWVRDDIAEVQVELPKGGFHVVDPYGHVVAHQRLGKDRLLIRAEALPPMGFAVYRIVPGRKKVEIDDALRATVNSLENELLRIRLDKEGRVITAEFPDFQLVNVYTPNAQDELRRLL